MRCNSNPRPLTDDAAGKPNPSELPGGEAMDAQMTAAPAPQKTKILVEYARLTESENIVDGRLQIAPTQVDLTLSMEDNTWKTDLDHS